MSQDPAPLSGRATPVAAEQWADFPYPAYSEPAPRRRQGFGRFGRRPPRPPVASEAPLSRVLSLIEPVILMAFGALLGLMDQTATETSGWLRVPALVAALLIVAQAISDFQARRQDWFAPAPAAVDAEPSTGRVIAVVEPAEPADAPGRAVHRSVPVTVRVSPVAAAARENPRIIYFVMGLSVWLALATLANPTAPWPLLVLSLLAAFLLFAEAWQMLRSRK